MRELGQPTEPGRIGGCRDGLAQDLAGSIVLGHQPPATDTQHWLDTAVSLLMYRVIYEVSDPVVDLGPPTRRRRRSQSLAPKPHLGPPQDAVLT
ncbi:hypothetical protein [Micromonospora ureilytica]|uniref:Tetracyclin repressor-like C-terminal domain-containing protein n=1 Tax=Micromonospora ureilytica TaxID=709868 RepID=A0ABS0JJC8_9ACTN|nr:hypothetical protein [Micromonospora ureilytica]MBG6067014.1 hypothetical protein [Micromonospora ureilytica]